MTPWQRQKEKEIVLENYNCPLKGPPGNCQRVTPFPPARPFFWAFLLWAGEKEVF